MKDLFEEILHLAGCDNETLIESVSDIKVRNAPNMSVEEFRKVISYDPVLYQFLDLPDAELGQKPNSYLLWLVKHWNNVKNNSADDVRNLLADFTTLKNRRKLSNSDINSYNSIAEIIEAVNSAKQQEDSLTRKQKDARKASKNADSDIIHLCSGDIYDMYYPKTYGASVKLGKGTRWCTATNSSDEHYKIYSELGPLFVFINKKNTNEKYQLWYSESGESAGTYDGDHTLHNQDNPRTPDPIEVLLKDEKIYNYLHNSKQITPYLKKYWPKEMELPYDEVKDLYPTSFEYIMNQKGREYKIKEDGSIVVSGDLDLSHTQITSFPDNLKVSGSLYLSDTPIASLPDNLHVGRSLNLNYTKITSLPDNLKVGGGLYLSGTKIAELPDNLHVGDNLDLYDTPITSLPDNLQVGGYLDLSGSQIASLPDNLHVDGDLYLRDTPITSLPDNLHVGGSLDLYDTPITTLSNNLQVGGSLDLSQTKITSLPNNLQVGGGLNLSNTQIAELPDNLQVGGGIDLNNTQIAELPDNLHVVRYLYLRSTPITSLPNNLKVGGNLDLCGTKITTLPDNLQVVGLIWVSDEKLNDMRKNNPKFKNKITS